MIINKLLFFILSLIIILGLSFICNINHKSRIDSRIDSIINNKESFIMLDVGKIKQDGKMNVGLLLDNAENEKIKKKYIIKNRQNLKHPLRFKNGTKIYYGPYVYNKNTDIQSNYLYNTTNIKY